MLPCGESEVGSIFTKNEMTGREQNKNIPSQLVGCCAHTKNPFKNLNKRLRLLEVLFHHVTSVPFRASLSNKTWCVVQKRFIPQSIKLKTSADHALVREAAINVV